MAKKYVSLTRLSGFLDNLKSLFATKTEVDQKSQVQIITLGETESTTENLSTLKIHKLTQEQYDEKLVSGNIDESALYLTPDEEVDLSGYATIEQLESKSDISHSHNISDISELQSSFDLINENLSAKAELEHTHEASDITDIQELLNERASINTTINGKSLNSDIALSADDVGADTIGSAEEALESAKGYTDDLISTKADIEHSHNDMYYTESEVDEKISEVSSSISNIIDGVTIVEKASYATNADNATSADSAIKATQDSNGNIIGTTYETKNDASSKLSEAKSYADNIKNDLLNGAGTAYDTLKELGDLIDDNTDAIDALNEVASGKANKEHTHSISDVTNLQSNLDAINNTLEDKSQVQIISEGISEILSTLKIHKLTQEEYDQEVENGTLEDNAIYLTPEEEIDLSGYATIEQVNNKANEAKLYTDSTVSQKTQVQIILWEDDD